MIGYTEEENYEREVYSPKIRDMKTPKEFLKGKTMRVRNVDLAEPPGGTYRAVHETEVEELLTEFASQFKSPERSEAELKIKATKILSLVAEKHSNVRSKLNFGMLCIMETLSLPVNQIPEGGDIEIEFIIDGHFVSAPYKVLELLDLDEQTIIENMEQCDCQLNESNSICEGDCIKFENSKITGYQLSSLSYKSEKKEL